MKRIILLFVSVFLCINISHAELVAEVTQGVIAKPLVSIMSDNIVSDFANDTNKIVKDDLNHSGKIDANSTIEYKVEDKNDIPWSKIKADYAILIKYHKNSTSSFNIEVQIIKRNDHSLVKSLSFKDVNQKYAVVLGHKIANYIYKKLNGDEGFFLTKIAYVKVINPYSRYGRIYELIIADYDGKHPRLALKQKDNPIATPSWSNDGKKIIYSSYSGGGMGIYQLDLSSGNISRISNFKGINSSAAFSPDDKDIVLALSKGYSDQTNIYTMSLASKKLRRLTLNGRNTAPKYSPDGKKIVFTSDRGGRPGIYEADVSSKYPESKKIVSDVYKAYEPNYTPDGSGIVFMSQSKNTRGTHISYLDRKTGDLKDLTSGIADSSPSVSPFGDMVVYASNNSGSSSSLAVVSLDGETHYVLQKSEYNTLYQSPAWSSINF